MSNRTFIRSGPLDSKRRPLVANCVLYGHQDHFKAHICMKLTSFLLLYVEKNFSQIHFFRIGIRSLWAQKFFEDLSQCLHLSILWLLTEFMLFHNCFHLLSQKIKLHFKTEMKFTFFLHNEHQNSEHFAWGKARRGKDDTCAKVFLSLSLSQQKLFRELSTACAAW